MDYTDVLRRLAIHDSRLAEDVPVGSEHDVQELDPKTLSLARLGALIAVGGSIPSYGVHADAAVDAGATVTEIVDVLVGVIPVAGLPRVVAAAPLLAMALGYDIERALETHSGA